MYKRILEIENMLDEGNFLLGARQTGKSTLLQERFPDAICYDLLKSDLRKRFKKNPELLREILEGKPTGTLVIIDEVTKVLLLRRGCGKLSHGTQLIEKRHG